MEKTRKKIMLVDDDRVVLKIGRHVLKETYDVYPLPSAADMFKALEEVIPDLILLDIVMPDMDGLETIKRLKADSRYDRIPVIFVTSIGDDQSVFEHLKIGAYSNLTKPYTSEELLRRVENCLNDFFPAPPSDKKDEKDKPVILAIDDAPDILKMVQLLLKDKYKIYTLSDPAKLKDLLADITPDMFLLDYNMPELTGFDLMPIIRSYTEHRETPVIYLTSVRSADFLTVANRLGASDYIMKPIKVDVLREKVGRHLNKL